MKITIAVTRTDIRRGERGSIDMCPIALAIRRQLHTKNICIVDLDDNEGRVPTVDGIKLCLPTRALRFIRAFDNETRTKPFSFSFLYTGD